MSEQLVDINYALEGNSAYSITTDAEAEAALRRVLSNNVERNRLMKLALDMAAQYRAKAESIEKEYQRKNEWDTLALKTYFDSVEKHRTKTQQSYRLISGRLVQKKRNPVYAWGEQELIDWARENAPQYLKETAKITIDWAGLKKALTVVDGRGYYAETGEELPVTVTEQEDVFIIEGGKNG